MPLPILLSLSPFFFKASPRLGLVTEQVTEQQWLLRERGHSCVIKRSYKSLRTRWLYEILQQKKILI